jgi:glycosyltransferase 2 family protein
MVVVGPLLLLVPGVAERPMRIAYRKVGRDDDDEQGLARFLAALRANVGRPLLVTIPLTLAAFTINYVQGWLIGHALGLELSLLDATCLLAIASLLGLLPISVSGIGVRELFFSLIFPVLGLGAAQGVSFGLMVFLVLYLALAVIGFVGWQVAPPPTSR